MEKQSQILKKIVVAAGLGIAIGTTIELIMSAVNGNVYLPGTPAFLAKIDNQVLAVGLERFAYACLGVILLFASEIYAKENWSLLKVSFIHFLISFTSVLTTGLLLVWIPPNPPAIFGFLLVYLLIYLVIWATTAYCIYQQIKKLNQKIGANTKKNSKIESGT